MNIDHKSLLNLQEKMMDYLINGESIIEKSIVKQGKISNQTRLNIYKNAYQARLKEVIENDHPVLGLYLGDDLFDEMVLGYLSFAPSNNTSLRHYADKLPKYLDEAIPFNQHPIISEVAQFERGLLDVFDAEDANRYTKEDLQKLSPSDWTELILQFHPSVQLSTFQWNCVESWQALKNEETLNPATRQENLWLLWRNPERLTQFRSISHEEETLIRMILAGNNFSELCEFLFNNSNHEDISLLALNYINGWLDDGLLRKNNSVVS